MEEQLVSVITVTRNRCNLIGRAIESVLGQTYRNIEYIIVDGASTDDTINVVKDYEEKDSRLKYFRLEKNMPVVQSIWYAFEHSKGKYVTFLDDDDEYHLEKIEKEMSLFSSLGEDYGMVYCWMTYYDNDTKRKIKVHNPALKGFVGDKVVEYPIVSGTPTFLIRHDIFKQLGGWNDKVGIITDWELATRLCQKWKIDLVPESLVNVYVNHGATRMSAGPYYRDRMSRTVILHQHFLSTYKSIFDRYPERAWYHYDQLTRAYYYLGKKKEAKKCYAKMLESAPTFSNRLLLIKCFLHKIHDKLFGK